MWRHNSSLGGCCFPDDREGRYPSVRYERMPLAIIGLH